jgi:hypothetical protein
MGTDLFSLTANSQCYTISSGLIATALGGTFPLALWNPVGDVNRLMVSSIRASSSAGAPTMYIQQVSSNPAYATSLTPVNHKSGGVASNGLASFTSTSQATPSSGLVLTHIMPLLSAPVELLSNDDELMLPAGFGVVVFVTVSVLATVSMSMSYIEY